MKGHLGQQTSPLDRSRAAVGDPRDPPKAAVNDLLNWCELYTRMTVPIALYVEIDPKRTLFDTLWRPYV
jgi:hypothetical protein